jgi:hypothetical protein
LVIEFPDVILEVPVVIEFPDVFPEELAGISPDRDIEFGIDLVPDTAPIYKRHYSMVAKQLAELKEHIKELLEKGYSSLAHPRGSPCDFCPEER